MPPRRDRWTDRGEDHDCAPSPSSPSSALTAEQVQRWAELIADGSAQFPADLAPPDRDRLLAEVSRRRRDRLIQHIARAVALDLRGAEQPK
jgi:hypothetical protein